MRALLLAALLLTASAARAENPVVRFATELGAFDVELCAEVSAVCPAAAANSVTNFLGYVDRGDYVGSVVHRSTRLGTSGVVVIQGGGFRLEAPDAVRRVPTQPAIQNQFNQSNVRGTLAYARLQGQTNSATSQWFVNVVDNTGLDTVDGGFTVFGVVIGDGMEVVDDLSALSRVNMNAEFLDPIFGPDPELIASAFTETPVNQAFYEMIAPITDPEDFPPPVDFAQAMIDVAVTRVPEPGAASAGLGAGLALAALARRWRGLRRR